MTRPEAESLCREMYGHSTAKEIKAILGEYGFPVSEATVRDWADPAAAARNRKRRMHAKRERRVMDRMRTLHNHGVPFTSISVVMTVDLGFDVSEWQVRSALDAGRLGRRLRKAVAS